MATLATLMTDGELKGLGITNNDRDAETPLPNLVLDPPNPGDAPINVSQKGTFPNDEENEEEGVGPTTSSVQTTNFSSFKLNEQPGSSSRESATARVIQPPTQVASTHASSSSPVGETLESLGASYHTLEVDREKNDNWHSTRTSASVRRFFTRRIRIPASLAVLSLLAHLGLLLAVILISTIGKGDENGRSSTSSTSTNTTTSPTTSPKATTNTLASVKAKGTLNCGVVEQYGFSTFNKTSKQWEGFEVDLCHAIAATIFDTEGENVNFVALNDSFRFRALQSKEVDVLAAMATFTMQRDVFEPTANAGFTFSAPYLYNGLGFAGQPQYVECAEAKNTTGNCSAVKICVQAGTTHVKTIQTLFPSSSRIVQAPTMQDFYKLFVKGLCNVLAGEQFDLAQAAVSQAGYRGSYIAGQAQYSKEPIALVTRDDDPDWSNLVNWVLLGLLTAENQNIGRLAAASVFNTPTGAIDKSQIDFYRAVAKVGNYGEIYKKHLESLVTRATVNMLNNGSSPLLYSIPFGEATIPVSEPKSGGTLDRILQRGFLICGISDAPFFVEFQSAVPQLSGFDVDYCRAISVAIFNGTDKTVFIPVLASERFQKLASGEVDLLSRITSMTYQRDVNEPTTNKGFTFTQPVFYTGLQFGGIPEYSNCASEFDTLSDRCKNLTICVNNGTTTIDAASSFFQNSKLTNKSTVHDVIGCLASGEAEVIAVDGFATANYTIYRLLNYSGPYKEDPRLYSRDTFAIVTRQDDLQWSSFVYWIVTATFYAEEQGISQANGSSMPLVHLFGPSHIFMLQNAIKAVGSYADIYQRNNPGSHYPRAPVNTLNKGPFGPQHFPPSGLFGLT